MSAESKFRIYEEKCDLLLKEEVIRFAGIVDENGKLVSGGSKKGLEMLEDNESKLQSFMEFVAKVSIRKDYDATLGPINYLAARRDKIVLISFPFPISKIILLISAEPTVNIESLAKRVVKIFAGV